MTVAAPYSGPRDDAAERSVALTVELVGARGVGKSTLRRHLAEELNSRNLLTHSHMAPDVRSRLTRHLTTLGDRSRFVWSSLAWRPLSSRELRNLRKRYRRLRFAAVAPGPGVGIRLVDEGVFQLIMEIQAKTAQKDIRKIARRIARLVPAPDLVILVEASEETIASRRRMRANAGDILRPQVAPWERVALDHTKALLTDLAGSGRGPELLVLDNDRNLNPRLTATRIANELEYRYRRQAVGWS